MAVRDSSPKNKTAVNPAPETTAPSATINPRRFLAALADKLFGIDLRALACFRIILGFYILADLATRAVDLEAFYTDYGAFPLEAAFKFDFGIWMYLSPYMYVTSVGAVAILFLLHALAGVAFLVGWKTRWSTFFVWFFTMSLHARSPLVLHSGDVYLRMMLFWSLFVPLGARYSVDGLAAELVARKHPLPKRLVSFGTAGMLLQVAFMYWFSAMLKTGQEWHGLGTAVYYALSIEQYALPLGQWIREIRWLIRPLTAGTMILEIVGPFLAFAPHIGVRIGTVAAFLGFHLLGLNLTMNIGMFVYIAAIPWVLFLPTWFWDFVTGWWTRLPNNPVKSYVMEWREKAIDWRSRQIAKRIQKSPYIPRLRPSLVGQIFAAFFIGYVLLVNLKSVSYPWTKKLPTPPWSFTLLFRVDQNWAMFAPRPTLEDGWFVIPARTVSGHWVDLFRHGAPVSWDKPSAMAISYSYPNDRWCKYMMNLWGAQFNQYRLYYCRYLERQWLRKHPEPEEALEQIDVYFMLKMTQPDYKPYDVVKILIWSHNCGNTPPPDSWWSSSVRGQWEKLQQRFPSGRVVGNPVPLPQAPPMAP